MISYTELKKGMMILWNSEVYEVVDIAFVRMQQRKAVVQSKIKQLKTGKVIDKTWQASDAIEEPDFQKKDIMFLYSHKGEFWFHLPGDPKNRFMVAEDVIGEAAKYLKPNTPVNAFMLEGTPIKINLPIKMDFKVTEAPPAVKGNTAQGGDKSVTIETGAKVTVPLFINEGDIIKINTETGAYYERVEKSK
jgi:elongation factor P